MHSTAKYCAPVWCRSAHTRLIDPTINDALRIVTGCLRPTPADNLPILAGIQPAELRPKCISSGSKRFSRLKTEDRRIICTTRLLNKLGLWNRKPNLRLRLHHLKCFGSGHPKLLGLRLNNPGSMEPRHLLHSRSSVHRVQTHSASNRHTHLCPPHNNSSVHLTTATYVRRSWRITDGMRSC